MFEIDLKYCPLCKDEYRAEITRCAACSVELVWGEKMLQEKAEAGGEPVGNTEITPEDTLVTLMKGSVLDMKNLKAVLARKHIPAILANDGQCRSGCCGAAEVLLQIRREDAMKASAVMQEEHERTTGHSLREAAGERREFNSEAIMVTCPACGHEFTPEGEACPDCGLCFF